MAEVYTPSELVSMKWSKLILHPDHLSDLPQFLALGSHNKYWFLCECGREFQAMVNDVTNGHTTSCRKCTWKSKDYWLSQKWESLRLDPNQELPDEWGPGVATRYRLLCDCGRTTSPRFCALGDNTKSCGKCNNKPISYWLSQKFDCLTLDPHQNLPPELPPNSSGVRLKFKCSCGRNIKSSLALVGSNTRSCGNCGLDGRKSREEWLTTKWGQLRLDPGQTLPLVWGIGLKLPVRFLCDCGESVTAKFGRIVRDSTTCTRCLTQSTEYWLKQKWGMLRLDPQQVLLQEWSPYGVETLKFICDCGGNTIKEFAKVCSLNTQSCGCTNIGKSVHSPAHKIYDHLVSLCPDTVYSHYATLEGSRYEFDMYTPSLQLAVEYHGLYWHMDDLGEKKDYQKHQVASRSGIRVVQIYADEWENRQESITRLVTNLAHRNKSVRITPEFSFHSSTSTEARRFLDQYHYLGASSGAYNIEARYRGTLVGVWVIQRRSTTEALWHRACWDHNYRAWNPHEKALKLAIEKLKAAGYTNMVTFSDNRFHTGDLYKKLGFGFEKNIDPDYGYTNGRIRKSKQTFRVAAGVNELVEANKQGWHRVWDSGKKKFRLFL